jgi:hypothetical protein
VAFNFRRLLCWSDYVLSRGNSPSAHSSLEKDESLWMS